MPIEKRYRWQASLTAAASLLASDDMEHRTEEALRGEMSFIEPPILATTVHMTSDRVGPRVFLFYHISLLTFTDWASPFCFLNAGVCLPTLCRRCYRSQLCSKRHGQRFPEERSRCFRYVPHTSKRSRSFCATFSSLDRR